LQQVSSATATVRTGSAGRPISYARIDGTFAW
jgi:hypothetical protein